MLEIRTRRFPYQCDKDLAMPFAFAKAYMNDALWILPAPAEEEK